MFNFYDTSSLLLVGDKIKKEDNIVISSITLQELENIKTSMNKSPEIKFQARVLLRFLEEHPDYVDVIIFNEKMLEPIEAKALTINDDMRILATAFWYDYNVHPDEVNFITNDLCLKHIANLFFGDGNIGKIHDEKDYEVYNGYIEVSMDQQTMSDFYQNLYTNSFNLLTNQYIVVQDLNNTPVDCLKWTGEKYEEVPYRSFKSNWFGDVKPYKGDLQQQMISDSFNSNQITMVKGPAGSGKTYLSLGFLMHLLEKGKIDKIIVFCNTVATKNSARLGYYPGTKDEKLLDSQIGNLLISKLGDRFAVEDMIAKGNLLLLPLSDIRGYDTTGMRAGIYVSEAQNLDINLMKLTLQRIGSDSICIIDGDFTTQVDDTSYAGMNNGMRRASEVFRGSSIYGEITLKNIYRSKIAEIADKM